jgi:hypothetical protein
MYTSEKCEDEPERNTLILTQLVDHKSKEGMYITGRIAAGNADEDDEKYKLDTDGSFFGSDSAPSETATESDMARSEASSSAGRTRSSAKRESMGLQVCCYFHCVPPALAFYNHVSPLYLVFAQVRIVVHSSIHPQNATLNEFLCRIPDAPAPLPAAVTSLSSPWKLSRPELLKYIATAEAETELDDDSDEMQKLLLYTIDVARPSLCSPSESSAHFLRIFGQLMRTIVSGNGTPSVVWANPASAIPLRMHAFATLLQILNGINTYMVRTGCTQLDGKSRWNLMQLGRVVSMAFDEEKLFSNFEACPGEVFSLDAWEAMYIDPSFSKSSESASEEESPQAQRSNRRGKTLPRQPRTAEATNSEGSDTSSKDDSFAELLAALATPAENESSENQDLETSAPLPDSDETSSPPTQEAIERSSDVKIDSKSDFQNNLWTGSAESSTPPSVSGSTAAQTMIQAYSGGPSNRRKWMTAPTSGLATIREDAGPIESDLDESAPDLGAVVTPLSPERPENRKIDSDSEIVLRDPIIVEKKTTKKMRVPRVTKSIGKEDKEKKSASLDSRSTSSPTVPSTDEEILTAGTAFLETIGKNLGYRYAPCSRFSKCAMPARYSPNHLCSVLLHQRPWEVKNSEWGTRTIGRHEVAVALTGRFPKLTV